MLGDFMTDTDGCPNAHFDYVLANPPFGVDRKKCAAHCQDWA